MLIGTIERLDGWRIERLPNTKRIRLGILEGNIEVRFGMFDATSGARIPSGYEGTGWWLTEADLAAMSDAVAERVPEIATAISDAGERVEW